MTVLRVALQPADARWDVALYADNATDNRRFMSVGGDPLGYDENIVVSRVQGATYGIQARWNFGDCPAGLAGLAWVGRQAFLADCDACP